MRGEESGHYKAFRAPSRALTLSVPHELTSRAATEERASLLYIDVVTSDRGSRRSTSRSTRSRCSSSLLALVPLRIVGWFIRSFVRSFGHTHERNAVQVVEFEQRCDMEISEEQEQEFLAQLKALREQEAEQAGVIRQLKESKAERSALLPEVEKLNAIKAQISDVVRNQIS